MPKRVHLVAAVAVLLCMVLSFLIFASAIAEDATVAKQDPPEVGQEVPEKIASMIRIAQVEAATADRQAMPRSNKYTLWYFGDKRQVGWCSNFVSWCAHEAGLSLLKDDDAVPVQDDAIFVTNEARVPNTFVAYNLSGRITDIPKPGYEVIYGVLGSTPYTHVGIVESVKDLGEGVYEITTLEGNVANTVKRFCYRYLLNPKRAHHNFKTVPAAEQTRTDAQYKLHQENWYITGFGQTWK